MYFVNLIILATSTYVAVNSAISDQSEITDFPEADTINGSDTIEQANRGIGITAGTGWKLIAKYVARTLTLTTVTSTTVVTSYTTCTTSTAAISACVPSGRRRRYLTGRNERNHGLYFAADDALLPFR